MYLVGDLIGALETVLEPDAVDRLKRQLDETASGLGEMSFQDMKVLESVFGGSEAAGDLGFHHSRAHAVIAETITGVVADIRGFRDGLERAELLLESADDGAAADLGRTTAAVQALADATDHFAADAHNRAARNAHLGGDR